MSFQTEYDFTLPKGYVDREGNLHKTGRMRLATAADEILPMKDPRVQKNPGYLTIILLSRVITELGNLKYIDTRIIEGLFTSDLAYLQGLYGNINGLEESSMDVECPSCNHKFEVDADFLFEER